MRYFGCIFELSSESISRPYYQWGLSATDAIKKVYGTNSISPLIFSYVDEIEKTIDQHGGTTPCENKLNLLYVNYIKSATNSEEKQLISWIAGVTDGSYEYWDTQYTVWNPRLQGRFWNSTLRIGKRILISDVAGAIGYVAGSKLGWITGALTWKAVAATAGVASIIGGVDQLLEEIMSVKSTDTNTEYSVSREEIHKAYLYKSKRIRVMNPSLSKFLKTVLKCVGMAVVSTILSMAVYLIFKDWTLVKSTFISVFSVYVTLIIYQNYIQK